MTMPQRLSPTLNISGPTENIKTPSTGLTASASTADAIEFPSSAPFPCACQDENRSPDLRWRAMRITSLRARILERHDVAMGHN